MTNPFRDIKQMKFSNKRLLYVWREMAENKQKIVLMIMDAIKTKTELTDEQKLECLGLLPSFSDDEFALLCYYADAKDKPWFMYEE